MAPPASPRRPAPADSALGWGALGVLLLLLAPLWMTHPAPGARAGGEGAHPLLGRIYLAAEGRFIGEEELLARLRAASVVYLGERHDNPVHHQRQAALYRALLRSGRRPALAFEMFTQDAQEALSALLARPGADLSRVPGLTGWDRRGWPDWAMYAPLVEAAYRAGLPVVAADLPVRITREVSRKGLEALPPARARELALGPAERAHREAVLEDLFESHCRVVPRERLGHLYDAWRARNRAMALAIVRAARGGADGAVLITGAGHADRFVGIPPDVAALAPGTTQFSLAFAEVDPGERKPEAYLSRAGAHDAIWFTARHEREDSCLKYRKALDRLGKGG